MRELELSLEEASRDSYGYAARKIDETWENTYTVKRPLTLRRDEFVTSNTRRIAMLCVDARRIYK